MGRQLYIYMKSIISLVNGISSASLIQELDDVLHKCTARYYCPPCCPVWECEPGKVGTLCQIPIYVRTIKLKQAVNIFWNLVYSKHSDFFNRTMTYHLWSLLGMRSCHSVQRILWLQYQRSVTSGQPKYFMFFMVCVSPQSCAMCKKWQFKSLIVSSPYVRVFHTS